MKRVLIFFLTLVYSTSPSQEISGFENFILASEYDRNILVQRYFSPLFNSAQTSMSEGWVKTAKTHKKLGFDFTFFVSGVNVPFSAREFRVDDLSGITSSSNSSPTIFGVESEETYTVVFSPQNEEYSLSTNFSVPSGYEDLLTLDRAILPNLQFSLGVPFKTELIFRYMPESKIKGAGIRSYGFGVKHSISQYFKTAKITPFNLSLLATSSKIEASYNFGNSSEISGENQSANLNINNISAGLVASIDLKIVSFYTSMSQVFSESMLNINGTYNLNYISSSTAAVEIEVSNPISIKNELNYFRKNVGIAFNLSFFNLFIDYSIQEYNSINLGMSLGIR